MTIDKEIREMFMLLPLWNARDALRLLLAINPDSVSLEDDFDGTELEVEARALIGWLYRYGILPRSICEPQDTAPELVADYLDAIGEVRRTPAEWIAAASANPGAPAEWLELLQTLSGTPESSESKAASDPFILPTDDSAIEAWLANVCPMAIATQLSKELGTDISRDRITEYLANSSFINWNYWVAKMPILTAAQASRLMVGLDPDVFESLDSRPNKLNPSPLCSRAKSIERTAVVQQITSQSPAKWLEWADAHPFLVHDAYRVAITETLNLCESEGPKNKGEEPLQRQRFQEQEIIRALNELGHNPQSIPKWKAGECGVKSTIREFLKDHNWSKKVFDKAWQRLRDGGEIAEI